MPLALAYLTEIARIRSSGEAADEVSYYPALSNLLNGIGGQLSPAVQCVLTPRNRGAGVPDGGFFLARGSKTTLEAGALLTRAPERGVMEVKPPKLGIRDILRTSQVRRYCARYGQVMVTNYREFQVVQVGPNGEMTRGEFFSLCPTEAEFWATVERRQLDKDHAAAFEAFLHRVLLADAPLTSPSQLAWFLAAHARAARARLDTAQHLPSLETLRIALEEALGVRFEGGKGQEFFRSALVQTLFYGLFAAWVVWSEQEGPESKGRFSWRTAQWTLDVPMVRVLFEQLATPRNLPVGLDEILDWTEDVLARVDRRSFFLRFDGAEAIQYFYEPFLEAYDPALRRELGVWYTPPEVVRYMVERVHEALKRDLGVRLGLADDCVHVLDPCAGTGSFLIEALRVIERTLREEHQDELVPEETKFAALGRVHGFELLPAPFVVAHLQLGLFLHRIGAPLESGGIERASVFLTNALSGWQPQQHNVLPFEEFRAEREAAGIVKRQKPILVVIGNPPYNGYAGVSEDEDGDLLRPYKEGLAKPPWEITKNKLDDLYIRFFRVAERRIAERTGRGIVCFITNAGWLGDPSAVVMRKRLIREFDRIVIENLNGDSRETGKKTPDGRPDPSVFSTRMNPEGIQVGTAIAMLVRTDPHTSVSVDAVFRDFWGATKRHDLLSALEPTVGPPYEELRPDERNWYRLKRWAPRPGYEAWPQVTDLAAEAPQLGLNENRNDALVSIDREVVSERLRHFLDPALGFDDLERVQAGDLLQPWADYNASGTRARMLEHSPFDEARLVPFLAKPFDVRWAYVDVTPKLWNRARPDFVRAARIGSDFLLVRRRAPRALDGAAFLLSAQLMDQHVLHKDAYAIPLLRPASQSEEDPPRLFDLPHELTFGVPWRPNLSAEAEDYLRELGYHDARTSPHTAGLIWLHALAVGYSPQYLEENGDAVRNSWPRVPLPRTADQLALSAQLGLRLAALLDVEQPVSEVDASTGHLAAIADFGRVDGTSPERDDLEISAGWGRRQSRTQKSGATSTLVMPGEGRTVVRQIAPHEAARLSSDAVELLGTEVIDVYLNGNARWSGVPLAAWDYKVGGFHVLRKWLSYRESAILGRRLNFGEVRQFRTVARRLTALVLLGPELDANYRSAAGIVSQDALPMFPTSVP